MGQRGYQQPPTKLQTGFVALATIFVIFVVGMAAVNFVQALARWLK